MSQVDPTGPPTAELSNDERARLLRQHYAELGKRSGAARRAQREQRKTGSSIDELIDQLMASAAMLSPEQRARLEKLL